MSRKTKILNYLNVNKKKYEYFAPHKTDYGSYISSCNYRLTNNEIIPFYVETPRLVTTSGIVKIDNKFFMDIEIPIGGDKSDFYDFLTSNDEMHINVCHNNSREWFGKVIPLQVIENYYKSSITLRSGGKNPILRLRVPSYRGKVISEIYNHKKELINSSYILPDDEVICIIELVGLRFLNQQFFGEYELQKVKIFKNKDERKIDSGYLFSDNSYLNMNLLPDNEIVNNVNNYLPNPNTLQPISDNQEPCNDNQEPINDNQEPINDNQEPNNNNQEPNNNNQEPINDNQEPINDNQEPINDNQELANDNQESANDNQEPINDNQEPINDNQEPINDNQESANDNQESANDNQESANDNQESANDNQEKQILINEKDIINSSFLNMNNEDMKIIKLDNEIYDDINDENLNDSNYNDSDNQIYETDSEYELDDNMDNIEPVDFSKPNYNEKKEILQKDYYESLQQLEKYKQKIKEYEIKLNNI